MEENFKEIKLERNHEIPKTIFVDPSWPGMLIPRYAVILKFSRKIKLVPSF